MSHAPAPPGHADEATEAAALAHDARLVRGVRWRLVAWSGGVMLVVLVLLGAAIYTAVASSLERSSVARLESRVAELLPSETADFDDQPPLDLSMGGASSGTFAFLLSADGHVFRPRFDVPADLPDTASALAAHQGATDVRTTVVDGVPFRILSVGIDETLLSPAFGRVPITAVQVVEDRSAEQAALDLTFAVLVVGGLAAVGLALLGGAVYAWRALVPIRESLAARQAALRRQREFAADASHELRTPLAIIRASVDDLRLHAGQPVHEVGSALDDIDAEVGQLTGLVDDLLLLARSDSGALDMAFEPVELGDVAATAAAAMTAVAGRRGVSIRVDPEPVMVSGDQVRLRQVVTILVDNAVRHSPRGGTVDVSVRDTESGAVLVVEDQGPGIPVEEIAHVFDRFWRGRTQEREGTGLGLAIAATIVTRHGGRIGTSDRPGGGARFTVVLPHPPAAPQSRSRAPLPHPGPQPPR